MKDPRNPLEEHTPPLPDALRWQLRGLRRGQEPARDLWSGIANRLPPREIPATPTLHHRWLAPVAMAASVLFAVGVLGWGGMLRDALPGQPQQPSTDTAHASMADTETPPALMATEASALASEYQAAFREIGPLPADNPMRPVIEELDRSASQLLAALSEQPDSRLLFDQLRRTYARRLTISQQLLHS